jgi:TatD DNase family protein
MLFDSHSHAHFNAFKEDSDEVIKRALDKGVEMLLVGTHLDTSAKGVEVAEKYDGVWSAIGLHPTHTTEGYFDPKEDGEDKAPGGGFNRRAEIYNKEAYRKLAQSSKKVVAIGEVGLDYYRLEGTEEEKEKTKQIQREVFQQQLDLACELDLAVCIHCRDAHDEVYEMLKATKARHSNLRGVIHCFTGTPAEAKKHMTLGFLISWTGIITFSREWDEFIKETNISNFLVETDCPYLTPVPHRGKRNEPAYVEFTARKLAELKCMTFEEVAEITTRNAKKLFRI